MNKKTADKITKDITKDTPASVLIELAPECRCSQCANGCKYGSGYLFSEEAEKIAEHLKLGFELFKEKYLEGIEIMNTKAFRFKLMRKNSLPYGQCVFFKDNLCSINEHKPLHCKISTGCKSHGENASIWFMLNNFVNPNDPESIRQYSQYMKTGGKTISGGELKELIPDDEKLRKILNYEVLK